MTAINQFALRLALDLALAFTVILGAAAALIALLAPLIRKLH